MKAPRSVLEFSLGRVLELCVEPPRSATLLELRRAVGNWPWRTADVAASSGKPISEEMTMWLALVIFGGYELFPDPQPGKK